MSINSFINVPFSWSLFALPLHPFAGKEKINLKEYERVHKMFFTHNMQIVVQVAGIRKPYDPPQYLMSVVRRDGRGFEFLNYEAWLKDQLFPSEYVITTNGVAEEYKAELKPVYPMWLFEGVMHRQGPNAYDNCVVVRSLIMRGIE